jgi:threonine aldolase
MVGGGTRQAGVLAAAGIYALDHHLQRLEEDHRKARRLAQGLTNIQNIIINPKEFETNILYFNTAPSGRGAPEIAAALKERGVLVHPTDKDLIRSVTHMDVSFDQIDQALNTIEAVMAA